MKVYRAWLEDRIDEQGLRYWVQVGELVELGGLRLVDCGGVIHREVELWHESRQDAIAAHADAVQAAAERLTNQAARFRADRAGAPARSGVDAAGRAPPAVAT